MSPDKKPSRNEDEYFAKLDAELIKTTRSIQTAKAQEAERRQHYMKCPKDGYDLVAMDLHGVQIDFCAHCSGFWLDSGELAEIIKADQTSILARVFTDVRAALARARAKSQAQK
jgi:hypothetical protein